jgi:hypothetical protein
LFVVAGEGFNEGGVDVFCERAPAFYVVGGRAVEGVDQQETGIKTLACLMQLKCSLLETIFFQVIL